MSASRKLWRRDGDVGRQELVIALALALSTMAPMVLLVRRAVQALEHFRDLLARAVHRRPHDVRGTVAAQLHDVLGEVGLDALDAGFIQAWQADLLARHRLLTRVNALRARLLAQAHDDSLRGLLGGHCGP